MTDRERLIELMQKRFAELIKDGDWTFGEMLTNVAEHLLANGVIVPPCKVGDTVYCLIQGFENPLKATLNRITIQASGTIISCSVLGYFGQSYMATDFGKSVFLTKEEAENALKEREGNG